MAVQKFRTLDEAERALWLAPGDPAILSAMRAAAAWARLAPRVPPPRGIRKFRTIEEANADRDEWEDKIIQAARQRVVRREQS
jgi:hypothetical protein